MGAYNQLPYDRATAWRAALLHQLNGLRDVDAVVRSLQPAVALLSFDYCTYALRVAIPITRLNALCWSIYLEPWCEYYHVHGYLAIDPVLRFEQRYIKSVLWFGIATADVRFWAGARQHGFDHERSHTICDHTGIFDIFSLVRRATPVIKDGLAVSGSEMIWLSQRAHGNISTLMAERVLPDIVTRLKEIERQTLHRTTEDKAAVEIAVILEMTERNVNFYIHNAITEPNVVNKTYAVVKATLLGLIPATL